MDGLGATDMKGGLAVMIELARWAESAEPAYDVGFLFFPREELGPSENPLPALFEQVPLVDEAALVICLEPTDNTLQLGCLGNLNARVVFEGRSAHSARPWLGVNAVRSRSTGCRHVLDLEPRDVVIEGLLFREVLSVTQIHGGIATNVIPARVEATLNFRYAPDRTPAEAEARVRELVGRDVEISRTRLRARRARRRRIVDALRRAGGFELQPKQAWTNVADFAARGLDAVNFGPGRDALCAHGRRARRDRRARADATTCCSASCSVPSRRCPSNSHPSSQTSLSTPSRGWTTGRPSARRAGSS